jgi:tetratricopeptide (TPR) repeat protein
MLMLSSALTASVQACINTFAAEIQMYRVNGHAAELKAAIAGVEASYAKEATLENSNDLAVGRILQGRYPEAIELLREVEKKYPGQAIVAANLGTALELAGQDAEALKWIRTGVQRDPDEHEGTEWLHVMILEAKIAMAKDPTWLQNHAVLGLDFGADPHPGLPNFPIVKQDRERSKKAIGIALSYQLGERTKFVTPPDPIVSDLYLTLANLNHAHYLAVGTYAKNPPLGELRFIDRMYAEALRYGSTNADLIDARRKQLVKDFPAAFEGSIEPAKVTKP